MKKNFLRLIAVLTALLIAVSCIGVSAVAEEPAADGITRTSGEYTEETSGTEEATEPAEPVVYTVEFVVDGEGKTIQVGEGGTLAQPADPVKHGYTFLFWYLAWPKQEEIRPFVFGREVVCDLELVAQFAAIEVIVEEEDAVTEEPEEEQEERSAQAPAGETADGESLDIVIIEDEEPAPADEEAVVVEDEPADEEAVVVEDEPADEEAVVVEDEPAGEAPAVTEIPEEEVPLAGPAPQRTVSVQSDAAAQLDEGTLITLTGVLAGFDGCDYALQWQCDNGSGWENVEGANGLSYSFAASAQSLNCGWRLSVTIHTALPIAG